VNIFVGNLSPSVTEVDLRVLFSQYGFVSAASVTTDPYPTVRTWQNRTESASPISRGYGYVEMPDVSEAQQAILGLVGATLKGHVITVLQALPLEKRKSKKK
jgi:RNA recognition motif-containing protein